MDRQLILDLLASCTKIAQAELQAAMQTPEGAAAALGDGSFFKFFIEVLLPLLLKLLENLPT